MNKGNLLIVCICFLGIAGFAFAGTIQITNPLCPDGAGSDGCVGDFPTLIQNIVNYVSVIVGSLSVLMFVWAGILFLSSAGDPGKIGKAKQVLIFAVIGTAIALAGTGLVTVVREVIGVPEEQQES
jgi:hypothetical protein